MHPAPASVIICAYTFDRYDLTVASARGALAQVPPPAEVVVVVDHNEELRERLAAALPDVTVTINQAERGLSGARNSGTAASTAPILVFLDDDAEPEPGWMAALLAPFVDTTVAIAGGRAVPAWEGRPPGWFPPEFLWVVGCSFRGQITTGPVRNPIGCSMAIRRSALEAVGGFSLTVGRIGRVPLGADETELAIRIAAHDPGTRVVIASDSVVRHHVPRDRQRFGYFVRRCFYEGISKAYVVRLSGAPLRTERSYVLNALPRGVLSALVASVRGPSRGAALGRAFAIAIGLGATSAGYVYGRLGSPSVADKPSNVATGRLP